MGQLIILCITGVTSLAIICNYLNKRAWYKYGKSEIELDGKKISSVVIDESMSQHSK